MFIQVMKNGFRYESSSTMAFTRKLDDTHSITTADKLIRPRIHFCRECRLASGTKNAVMYRRTDILVLVMADIEGECIKYVCVFVCAYLFIKLWIRKFSFFPFICNFTLFDSSHCIDSNAV